MSDQNNGNNLIKFNKKPTKASDKKSQRAGANGFGGANGLGSKNAGRDAAYQRAMQAQRGQRGVPNSNVRWFHYVQVIAMLVLVAWLMKSCQI